MLQMEPRSSVLTRVHPRSSVPSEMITHSGIREPPHLPVELIDEIIDCLASDKSSLALLGRVSRSCATRTRPHLFHDITLRVSRLQRFESLLPNVARHIRRLEIIGEGRSKLHVLHGVNKVFDLLGQSGADPRVLHLVNLRFVKHGDKGTCSWVPVTRFKHIEELTLKGCKFQTFGDFDDFLYSFPRLSRVSLEELNAPSGAMVHPRPDRSGMSLQFLSTKNIGWFAGCLNESLLATSSASRINILENESDGSPSDREFLSGLLEASGTSLRSLTIGMYLTHPAQAQGKWNGCQPPFS